MRMKIVGLVALIAATGPVLALEGPGRSVVASNVLRISTNPAVTSNIGSSVVRAFIPPYSGTVRLKWEIKSSNGLSVSANVSVHSMSNCEEQTTTSTAFVVQTCDIQVAGGFPVVINASTSDGSTKVSLRRVEMLFTLLDSDGKPIRFEAPGPA
jgi:hypothetical protein